jgi:hypothetical protein
MISPDGIGNESNSQRPAFVVWQRNHAITFLFGVRFLSEGRGKKDKNLLAGRNLPLVDSPSIFFHELP